MIRIATVGGLLTLAACATAPLELSEAQAGREVQLAKGQELAVRLASNPTTGYRWELRAVQAPVLGPSGEPEYVRDRVPAGVVGSGGTEIWRFLALRPGTQTLAFDYRRSWEREVPPARSVAYRVTVK